MAKKIGFLRQFLLELSSKWEPVSVYAGFPLCVYKHTHTHTHAHTRTHTLHKHLLPRDNSMQMLL